MKIDNRPGRLRDRVFKSPPDSSEAEAVIQEGGQLGDRASGETT